MKDCEFTTSLDCRVGAHLNSSNNTEPDTEQTLELPISLPEFGTILKDKGTSN